MPTESPPLSFEEVGDLSPIKLQRKPPACLQFPSTKYNMFICAFCVCPELLPGKINWPPCRNSECFTLHFPQNIKQGQDDSIRKLPNQPRRRNSTPSEQWCQMRLEPRQQLSHKTKAAKEFTELPGLNHKLLLYQRLDPIEKPHPPLFSNANFAFVITQMETNEVR